MADAPRAQDLLWLLDLAKIMMKSRAMRTLLREVEGGCERVLQADRSEVYLRERGSQHLRLRSVRAKGTSGLQEPTLANIAHRVLSARKPAQEGDVIGIPFLSESDLVGVICLQGTQLLPWEEHQTVYEQMGGLCAAAVENARMFERIQSDPLTGLPNNTHFSIQLSKAMEQRGAEENVGILFFDLDDFKRVNNRAGAEAGDQALIDIARTLQEVLRADGLVARYGSDKFALLLPPESGRADIRLYDAAERARAAIRAKNYHDIQMSVCIGGASIPNHDAESSADLIAFVDDALGRARQRGNGEVEIVWVGG